MKRKIQCALVLILVSCSIFAQTSATLSGTVTDAASRGISRASVKILNTNFGAVTDGEGKFTIASIPSGQYTLQVSAIGYATIDKHIVLAQNSNEGLSIQLSPSSTQLDVVIVSAQKKRRILTKKSRSVSRLYRLSRPRITGFGILKKLPPLFRTCIPQIPGITGM